MISPMSRQINFRDTPEIMTRYNHYFFLCQSNAKFRRLLLWMHKIFVNCVQVDTIYVTICEFIQYTIVYHPFKVISGWNKWK